MARFSSEEAAKELASFGLTGNQAKAYVALIQLKVAPVSKIAQLSKIRREEIYRMIPKLERLGLVEKILGKPIKYKSVPPREALSILFKRERESAERKMAELEEKRRSLSKRLESVEVKRPLEEEGPSFVLISDRNQAMRRMATMIRKAKKEIAIATPRYGIQFGYAYADVFRKAVKKGLEARILLEIDEIDGLIIKMLREAELFKDVVELRHTDDLTSHILITDSAEVIVGTFLRPTAEKHVDLWTNSPTYVDVMKAFFDRIWQDSVDIRSRIGEISKGKPIGRVSKPIMEHLSKRQKKRCETSMKKVIVVRKGEKVKTTSLKGVRFDLLLKTNVLAAELGAFEPGSSLGPAYKHMGQEIHIVLEGEIEFEIEGKKYLLRRGDVLCFPSILSHMERNPGKEKSVFFSVNVPPTFM